MLNFVSWKSLTRGHLPEVVKALQSMSGRHRRDAAANAAENDVGRQGAGHEGVAERTAAVAAVRGPSGAGQKRDQRLIDEENFTGLDVASCRRISASARAFPELDRARDVPEFRARVLDFRQRRPRIGLEPEFDRGHVFPV